MNKQIESFLTRKYYELKSIAKKLTKDDDVAHDLLHEVIIQLYDKENINLKSYEDNSIKYYITAIMRTNFYSKTSPFYYRIRKERILYVDINECLFMETEQEEFESELMYQLLEENYAELDWFRKSLLDMYLTLGSLKAVSRETTIPLTSISNYINQAKTQIKSNTIKKLYDK